MSQPLDYAAPPRRTDWARVARLAVAITALTLAGLPTLAAIFYGCVHWYQVRTNTIPPVPLTAGMLAGDLAWLSLILWAVVGVTWWIVRGVMRRRIDLASDADGRV